MKGVLMKNSVSVLVVLLMILVSPFSSRADEKVVARVNGVSITERDLMIAVNKKIPMISFHRNVSKDKVTAIKKDVLQDLINDELIYQDAKGKVTVSEEELEKEMEKVRKRFRSEDDYRKAIQRSGTTEEALKERYRRELSIKKLKELMIYEKAEVSEEEARKYYEQNKGRFLAPEKLKLWEIFLEVPPNATKEEREAKRKKAEEILQRIRKGEDFGRLAWDYSEDRYKYKSGELGYIHRGRLNPEVERALKNVKAGEITDVIETIYGYYIFKVGEIVPPKQLSFDEAKKKLIRQLRESRVKELRDAYIKRLREKAKIEIILE
jgi:peptidyl-prolyl cis-trans isomerase C